MLNKMRIVNEVMETGVVAVIRGKNIEEAINVASSCIKGGINAIEVTFTVPKAHKVIDKLKEMYGDSIVVGAGTVLDSETARIAILEGAEFIVSPSFDLETSKLCNRYDIPYMAGCMTIQEIIKAMEAGTDVVKLFPGSAFGPGIVKDIKAPLPQVSIMPTGGVSLDNIDTWIKNGCVAVGIGGSLTAPALKGDFEKTTELSRQFIEKVKLARGK
ncbi:2-dehydro-3-deoxyphosphogluconate aldolase / (4S)-4-hydroxy-2-oxoglutarate aldolase [Clostridium cavendishii DSM 21758]|uniref:2-dehydro-3-deoxyphosphogluconate aldolase / (4S)-4-hydroxy-2-oxoglutarate aldolase n=1 Tax=Clostridium cavendishii DSM 21758 TaxID=1121302 RepID=A0A1M6BP55_9CLOT|nr:bifunctional 2-keto-4-hydroxyglutarate aldolase/2-keto-3-deoxy-6-phosphogluconate aldolase [Clostridium cavendishii]SHI50466.1 2-dehydro-3-deoxyphosphogluconate aldolase / (4S)-4-hydroxy-2-oxoglutarate aldolase [Clostridium cavendishii DSM 21758]